MGFSSVYRVLNLSVRTGSPKPNRLFSLIDSLRHLSDIAIYPRGALVGDSCRSVDTAYFSTLVGTEAAMRLLRRAGLLGVDGAPPASIDMAEFWRLCAENIQATNDETHGVAAEPVPRGSLSVLFTAAKEADDLMGALERFAAVARLIRKECRVSLGRGRDAVRLNVTPVDRGSLRAEIYVECFIIVAHCALRWMTGRRLEPVRVRGAAALRMMGGALVAPHARLVRHGEGATIAYRLEDTKAPILDQKYRSWGEAEFSNFLALLDEEEAPQAKPRSPEALAVINALRSGLRSQTEVAWSLGISVPTLRRRLAEAGLSFRGLSAEHRQAELRELLATDLPIQDVAERLGLSDDRSLRRFCSERLGMSPRRYRRLTP